MAVADSYELIVNGVQCPPEFTHLLTPMEFEKMVEMFSSHDVEKTGYIDMKKVRDFYEMIEVDIPNFRMDQIISELTVESNGSVRFEEMCRFSVLLKTSSESRLKEISAKLARNKTTPVVEIYNQAAKRGLKVEFIALEIRETSDVGLAVHLTQVSFDFRDSYLT